MVAVGLSVMWFWIYAYFHEEVKDSNPSGPKSSIKMYFVKISILIYENMTLLLAKWFLYISLDGPYGKI